MAGEVLTLYLYAQFYDKDNYASNAQKPFSGAYLSPLAINFTEEKSQITQISVTFSYTPPETYGTQYKWSDYIQKGRRMTLWVAHTYDSPAIQIPIGTFIIDNIEQVETGGDRHLVVSGPELTQELADKLLFTPIGTYKVDIAYMAVAGPAPHVTALATAAPANSETLTLVNAGWADVDDEVRVVLDSGTVHATTVKKKEGNTVWLNHKIPSAAAAGKIAAFRERKIKVNTPELFYEGDIIKIYRNGGGNPPYDGYIIESIDDEGVITLSRGLLNGADVNNIVMREDYSTPTANDVDFVLADAYPTVNWTADIQAGRTAASALATRGASAFATLSQIADIHGEYFLAETLTTTPPTMLPQRKLTWRYTCRPTDIELEQVTTQAEADTVIADINKGVILTFTERIARPPLDTLYIKGAGAGISQISLADSSQAIRDEIYAKYGYTLTGDPGDIYQPYKLFNPAAGINREKLVTIDVLPESASPEAISSAANMMLRQGAAYLYTMSNSAKEYSVRIQCRKRIRPGDRIQLTYFDISETGSGHAYPRAYFQVISVSLDISTEGMYYDLTISTSLDPNERESPTDENTVSAEIIKFIRMREAFEARPTLGNFRTAIYDGRPPVGETITYLAGDGIAIAADYTLSVDAPDLAGLGLETSGNDLQVKLKADSGLTRDVTGLYLSPSTLTAITTNAVSGSGHTHDITSASNGKSSVNTILQSDTNGDMTLRFLTADKLISPEVETASGNITLDPASGKTINDGNLEFVGARSIMTSSGDLTLDPASGVTINDGHLSLVGARSILTTSGNLTLDPASGVTVNDGNLQFTGARSITTDSSSLTLSPVSSLILDPADDVAQLNANVTLKTAGAISGFLGTGWQVSFAGAGDFRSLFANSLRVITFTADTARVKKGSLYVTPSAATLSREFTLPAAVGTTATLYVDDTPGVTGNPVFADNEWIMLNVVDRTGGGLTTGQAWGQVKTYTDLANDEQSWTFTLRSASAGLLGKKVQKDDEVLDFGIAGDGWLWLTSTDDLGSPYLGMTTWQGANPYDSVNRSHRLRLGNLAGVSGMREWGLQAGQSTSNFVRFSELRSEIHGSRLSLYAGDNAQLRVRAVRVHHYRTAVDISYLLPNADHTIEGALVEPAAPGTYYTAVDENPTTPTTTDYIYNGPNRSGVVFLGLQNPTWNGTTYQVNIQASIEATGVTNDTIHLYGQVFDADQMTPLTGEKLIYSATANGTATPNVTCDTVVSNVTQTQWNNARLRLRWEYVINANEEAIRLDPNVPSIAVGASLPTGYSAGGDGLWVGRDSADGAYKLRIGDPNGVALRWTGTALTLDNSAGNAVVYLGANQSSFFALPMTIGASGGIWQATGGTFAAPQGGLKIWNNSGVGTLQVFNAGGTASITLDSTGLKLPSSSSFSPKNINEVTFLAPAGTLISGVDSQQQLTGGTSARYTGAKFYLRAFDNEANEVAYLKFASSLYTGGTAVLHGANGATIQSGASSLLMSNDANAYLTGILNVSSNAVISGTLSVAGASLSTSTGYMSSATHIVAGAYVMAGTYLEASTGISANYSGTPGTGQFVSDLAGSDWNAIVLTDTTDVAHGMTSIVGTSTYGALGKFTDADGGLEVIGMTESVSGVNILSAAVGTSASEGTGATGAVLISAYKRSGVGPSTTTFGDDENILSVRNTTLTQFIVKGNGDFYYNGTGSAYDTHDDVAMLVTLNREMWGGAIDTAWQQFINYNRQHLIDAGILSAGGFINGAALNRLLVGAIGQLNERIKQLEIRNG